MLSKLRMLKACLVLVLFCGLAKSQHPDAVYYNGMIVTMWSQHPIVQAVAISGDRFVAVGGNADALRLAGKDTRIVNLRGRCVVPGLIEGHVHPIAATL